MADLSPAAQAVWGAYQLANYDPYEIDPRRAELAAALCAAADQVDAMDVPEYIQGDAYWPYRNGRDAAKEHFLAIAAELDGGNG
jgi:hypothetical protein